MTRWIEFEQAAAEIGTSEAVFRRLIKTSKNPPPFVRPSERSMLFDIEALREWQRTWTTHTGAKLTVEERT